MSLERCTKENPLVRDGISQTQRFGKALDPAYFLLDERDTADLIEFCRKYARRLQYWDISNSKDGDWTDFIETSIVSVAAKIHKGSASEMDDAFQALLVAVAGTDIEPVTSPSALDFKALLDQLKAHIEEIYEWRKSAWGFDLEGEVKSTIKQKLEGALKLLIAYQKGADADPEIGVESPPSDFFNASDYLFLDFSEQFSPLTEDPLYFDVIADVAADGSIYVDTSSPVTAGEKIAGAITSIKNIHAVVLEVVKELNGIGRTNLIDILTNHDETEPHIALLLGFIQMFKQAQGHMNDFTQRHLDFFYRDVLQLEEKDAVPDRIHLVFELAQSIASHVLPAGTAFEAGKDATGVPIRFELQEDVVLNNAKVVSLKTIHILKDEDKKVLNIYKAPVANSIDGNGVTFTSDERWKLFGSADSSTMLEEAGIGFAVASPQLWLEEGERTVKIEVPVVKNTTVVLDGVNKNTMRILVSGEEGWIELVPDNITLGGNNALTVTVQFTLSPSDGKVVSYDKTIHGDQFNTMWPMAKVILNSDADSYQYDVFKNLQLTADGNIKIDVEVRDYRNLTIQNDEGVVDTSSPFEPFTSNPRIGSKFYIGSPEVFSKKLEYTEIQFDWVDLPDNLEEYYEGYQNASLAKNAGGRLFLVSKTEIIDPGYKFSGKFKLLDKKEWSDGNLVVLDSGGSVNSDLFGSDITQTTASFFRKIVYSNGTRDSSLTVLDRFSPSLKRGGIRMELDSDLLHSQFGKMMTQSVSLNEPDALPLPNSPYTPQIENLRVSYKSVQEFKIGGGVDQFFTIHPFGNKEKLIVNNELQDAFLVPDYVGDSTVDADGNISTQEENQGILMVGLANVSTPQILSIYVQVAQGTDDPDLAVPEVNWSYLAGDTWHAFSQKDILTDGTKGMIQSGVIRFSLPKTMDVAHTVMESGIHWIKADILSGAGAFNDVVRIATQGVEVVYVDQANDPSRLKTKVKSKVINKPLSSDAKIKSVTQYLASSGGKVAEQNKEYYARVSERLMHKNRAVSIRDYETIVLEEFPDIFRVKCVNHARLNTELAPGFVTVVAIPFPDEDFESNPFELKLSQSQLQAIRDLILPKTNLFIKDSVIVTNPIYEKVQFKFGVEFNAGVDRRVGELTLIEDIKQFVSPWAFGDLDAITFGNTVDRSVVLNFVEELSYVKFVNSFEMYHLNESNNYGVDGLRNVRRATASSAISILVTSDTHVVVDSNCVGV